MIYGSSCQKSNYGLAFCYFKHSHHIESGKLVIFMFQYNHARYTSRGGSKPFLAGFQPPKTILPIRPALLPQESVLSCQFKHTSNFKPKTSQCGTHAL